MMVRAGSACSTDCYSGSRFWIRSNHVESILDPSCHTWTLKYVFRWKVLFIFLYSGSRRKWSSVHIPAGFCSTLEPLESSAADTETASPSPVMAAGFSSVPTTCSVLFSLLCKRPTGKWGRQFTLACLCFAGSEQLSFLQDTQLSPPPEWRESCTEPARSARGNTSRSGKPANKLGRKAARLGPQREEIIQSAKSR